GKPPPPLLSHPFRPLRPFRRPMDIRIYLPPTARTTRCADRDLAQPGRLHQAVKQVLRLIGVEASTKGVSADVLARHLVLSIRLDPPQDAPGVDVAFVQADLPK